MRKLLLFVFATLTMVAQAADVSETLQKTDVTSIENVVSYRFNYPSMSVTGEPVVLSALLIAWNPAEPKATDAIETVHIYNHHTVTSDAECPTAEPTPNDIHVLMALTRGTYGIGLNEDDFRIEGSQKLSHPVKKRPVFLPELLLEQEQETKEGRLKIQKKGPCFRDGVL